MGPLNGILQPRTDRALIEKVYHTLSDLVSAIKSMRDKAANMTVTPKMLSFLKSVEGNRYSPYVPDSGKSGVTIGIGVDLGNMDLSYAEGIPQDIRARITPYLGVTGEAAEQALEEHALALSKEEIDLLSIEAISIHLNELAKWYNKASSVPFSHLTDNQQLVLLSVKYQYGNLPNRTPKFWRYATDNDWQSVYYELMNFGDDYPSRRAREGQLIAQDIKDT